MKNFKRVIAFLMTLVIAFSFCACGGGDKTPTKAREGYHLVLDSMGRTVEVPDNPQKIAAMNGPTFEMCLCLGAADRVVLTKKPQTSNYPAALLVYPGVAKIDGFNNISPNAEVNIEDYLQRGIDLALYYNNEVEVKKFDNAGIAAVVPVLSTSDIADLETCLGMSIETYKERSVTSMRVVAEAVGGESLEIYEKWKDYTNGIIDMLYERTKDLKEEDLPTVYWGNTWGENVLSSYVITNRAYEIRLAGGKLLGPTIGSNFPEVTAEQLIEWDPQYILVDNHGNNPDGVIVSVMLDSKFQNLTAVKNNDLHRIPAGVFFLDKGSTTALMTLWLATIIQPELFSDISMLDELKNYYKEFYRYDLSDEDAQHILDGWYYSSGKDSAD